MRPETIELLTDLKFALWDIHAPGSYTSYTSALAELRQGSRSQDIVPVVDSLAAIVDLFGGFHALTFNDAHHLGLNVEHLIEGTYDTASLGRRTLADLFFSGAEQTIEQIKNGQITDNVALSRVKALQRVASAEAGLGFAP